MTNDLETSGTSLAVFRSPEALPPASERDEVEAGEPSPPGTRTEEYPVYEAMVSIGQGPQNDITLDDDTVSTRHAQLEYVDGGWKLTDLESKNGTFVEGERLAAGIPTPLPSPSKVVFGAHELVFFVGATAEDAERAAAAYLPPKDRVPLAERTAFRLPVWLLALIILFLALLVTLFFLFMGEPQPGTPVPEPVTAFLAHPRMAA